jgi:tetratricopeptide (TPR) repeat protein
MAPDSPFRNPEMSVSMKAHNPFGRGRARGAWMLAVLGVALGTMPGCDFLDPTRVTNPQTTIEDLGKAARPTAALIPGLRGQFARALGAMVVTSETVSDNYSIQSTGLSKEVDTPELINPSVGLIDGTGTTGLYSNLQELRALADFVLKEVAPEDTTATASERAEALFYRGMALLMQGENFTAVPVEKSGAPIPARDLFTRAAADFNAALREAPSGRFSNASRAALARTYRMLGDAAQARKFATDALASSSSFVFAQDYDQASIDNVAFAFLISRATQEMQPLPRLDFLDPKYLSQSAAIPYLKAEEMHLILAEAALAANDEGTARNRIAQAVALAKTRPMVSFQDNDLRKNQDLTIRPRDVTFLVRAAPDRPFRAGLVLGRPGVVRISPVSNTSLDADSIRTLTDRTELIHTLFLARQEIQFLEGRRMSDLGIRLPISQREIDASDAIDDASPGTKVVVPGYVPRNGQMDIFTPAAPYTDAKKGENPSTQFITIQVDMNLRLAENFNQASPFLKK